MDGIHDLGGIHGFGHVVKRFLRDAKLNEVGGGTLESHQKNITKDLTRQRQRG